MLPVADDISNQAPGLGNPQEYSSLFVEFHMSAEHDPVASNKEGRPVYRDMEYITIRIPGDKDNDIIRAVRDIDKKKWPKEYAAFKAGEAQPVVGTPIEHLPFLSKAQVLEFKSVGVRTAENLRDMPDSVAQRFMGIHGLRKKAADFITAAEGAAPALALQAELAKRDTKIEELERLVTELSKKKG